LVDRTTGANGGAIEIRRRHRAWADRLREYHVLIDNERVGTLRDGQSSTYSVDAGSHRVQLQIDWARSEPRTVDVAAGDIVALECRGRNPLAALYWITFGRNRYVELTVVDP
jgi:hypothetical protein